MKELLKCLLMFFVSSLSIVGARSLEHLKNRILKWIELIWKGGNKQ